MLEHLFGYGWVLDRTISIFLSSSQIDFNDKWILAHKLSIFMIKHTNYMQLKKKEHQTVDTQSYIEWEMKKSQEVERGRDQGKREEGETEAGTGIGRDRRKVQRIRKLNRNMKRRRMENLGSHEKVSESRKREAPRHQWQ